MNSAYSVIHPVDQILTSLVQEAIPSDNQLIADQVFEKIKIPERSGTLLLENTRNFMGAPELDLKRAPGASRVSLTEFARTSLTFKAENYGLEESIAMEDIIDSQYPGSEEQRAAKKVRRALMLAREKRAADLLFDATVFTNTDTCTNLMSGKLDAAGTDALTGLDKLKDQVFQSAHGINPDTIILGRGSARALARNPEFRSYLTVGDFSGAGVGIAGGGQPVLNDEAVKAIIRDVLGIPNVYIGSARRETANPGATSSESQIWTDATIFCGILKGSDAVVQKSGGVKAMPVAALNFNFKPMFSGQYDSNDSIRRSVWVEEQMVYKAIDTTLGFVLTACI
mgnify:CR=1 FL=1